MKTKVYWVKGNDVHIERFKSVREARRAIKASKPKDVQRIHRKIYSVQLSIAESVV